MADMSDVLEVLTSIENYLVDLPTKIILRANQIFIVNGLSDVSENLGIVTAGEFRAGNRNEPGMFLRTAVAGSGFSGMRMRYPAMSYDLDGVMTDWNLVGINDDILQFGVRASDGKLVAGGGAVILDSTGITAVGGTIAGWTIDTTELTNTKIKISSAGSIESIPFVSGIGGSGWKISEDGDVEFNNAVVRGELRTTVLTYQEVQAVSGTMGVFQSAGVLSADLTLPAVPSGTYSIQTKAPNSTNPQIFDNNHILQIKNGTQSTWFIIDGGFGTSGDGYYWLCTYLSGTTDVTYTTGQAVISYGVSGDGFLLMEAIGTGSPYFSVRTHAGAPYTTTTEHVRMGNLNGWGAYASNVYGVAIGQYATGKSNIVIDDTGILSIKVGTTERIGMTSAGILTIKNSSGNAVFTFNASAGAEFTLPLTLATTGGIYQGTGTFASPTTGLKIWNDGGVGRIGGYNSGTLQWYASTDGKLYAGQGKVVVDTDGITIIPYYNGYADNTALKWTSTISGSYEAVRLDVTQSDTGDVTDKSTLIIKAGAYGDSYGGITLKTVAVGAASDTGYQIDLSGKSGLTIERFGSSLGVPVRLEGTLNIVGATKNTTLYDGTITTWGDIGYYGNLISRKNSTTYTGYIFVPLTTPLTSTSWDGDSFSTTAKTKIDLSSVFSVPAGVKAVLCNCAIRDSASAANEIILLLSPNNTANQGLYIGAGGLANDKYGRGALTVPCDSNGDIYYQIYASGAGTADVWLEIWGYYL